MDFIIYYYDDKQVLGSNRFTGGLQAAEIIAASGMIHRNALRATINDALTDEELKPIGHMK